MILLCFLRRFGDLVLKLLPLLCFRRRFGLVCRFGRVCSFKGFLFLSILFVLFVLLLLFASLFPLRMSLFVLLDSWRLSPTTRGIHFASSG